MRTNDNDNTDVGFLKNNMALPKNGYTDKMPVMSYQTGKEDDSDGDFHIDDIEQ